MHFEPKISDSSDMPSATVATNQPKMSVIRVFCVSGVVRNLGRDERRRHVLSLEIDFKAVDATEY